MKKYLIGSLLFAAIQAQAGSISTPLALSDFEQTGNRYTLELINISGNVDPVLKLHLQLEGQGLLTTSNNDVCTKEQSGDCIGQVRALTTSYFELDAAVSVSCEGRALGQWQQNHIEYTNEVLNSSNAKMLFDIQEIFDGSLTCQSVQLNIDVMPGMSLSQVSGEIRFANSTSRLLPANNGVKL